MAGEVDDRVGGAVTRLARQRGFGARRELGRDRRQAGRVDQAHRAQRRRRPLDDDALDGLRGELAERDRDRAAFAGERCRPSLAVARMKGRLVRRPVDVPGDDPGALPRIGRRQLFSDERIEQRRLARLDSADDRDPQGLTEPVADTPEPIRRRRALATAGAVEANGRLEQHRHLVEQARRSRRAAWARRSQARRGRWHRTR